VNSGDKGGWTAPIHVNPYIGESSEMLAAKQRIVSLRIAELEHERDLAIVAQDADLKTALLLQKSMLEDRLRDIEEAMR
jgi:hypothetical protein